MLGTSGTISWKGPGEVIAPMVIATAKSARPKIFQMIAPLGPEPHHSPLRSLTPPGAGDAICR
jgi:hypothetical protein